MSRPLTVPIDLMTDTLKNPPAATPKAPIRMRAGQIAPASIDDLWTLSKRLAQTEIVPRSYQGKPEDIIAAILWGSEIGFGPMQSLQSIAVIQGRASLWGDALAALVLRSGKCKFLRFGCDGEDDDLVGWAETHREGFPEPVRYEYTKADAITAKLWGKKTSSGKDTPWTQHPKRMLAMRARGFLIRDIYADLLGGFITREEAEDYPEEVEELRLPTTFEVRQAEAAEAYLIGDAPEDAAPEFPPAKDLFPEPK